jgi:hypothetical protein
MNCPKCYHLCHRDEAILITGKIYGSWFCIACGWSDDPQRDWSKGVPSAAVTIDEYLMRKTR